LNGKLRQPVHHCEDAVMVTRRNGFEKPSPRRLGCRQDKGGSTWIGGELCFDEIEVCRVAPGPDRKTNAPWPGPGAEDRIRGTSLSQTSALGNPVIASDHFQNHEIVLVASYSKCGMICSVNTFM
jgi:hypothetical protein